MRIIDLNTFVADVRLYDPTEDWPTDEGKIIMNYSALGDGTQTYQWALTKGEFDEMFKKMREIHRSLHKN